jgi:hypothetical protein
MVGLSHKKTAISQILLASQSLEVEIKPVESSRHTMFFWQGPKRWGRMPPMNGHSGEVSVRVAFPKNRAVYPQEGDRTMNDTVV